MNSSSRREAIEQSRLLRLRTCAHDGRRRSPWIPASTDSNCENACNRRINGPLRYGHRCLRHNGTAMEFYSFGRAAVRTIAQLVRTRGRFRGDFRLEM